MAPNYSGSAQVLQAGEGERSAACCAGLARQWYVWAVILALAGFGIWDLAAGPPEAGHVSVDSIGVELVYIPPGQFMMGDLGEARRDRQPVAVPHRVTLTRGFYIGRTEVTQRQWKLVMGESDPSTFRGGDLPVQNVTWAEAAEFCRRLSKKEGRTYRLPTEAEWEYACRAGQSNQAGAVQAMGWIAANTPKPPAPQVGATKRPNAWNVCDMFGNVAEWCEDKFTPYGEPDAVDPLAKSDDAEAAHVVRGGSFRSSPGECLPGYRASLPGGTRSDAVGFRVVCER